MTNILKIYMLSLNYPQKITETFYTSILINTKKLK